MNTTLRDLTTAWQRWADTADTTENGWESDFPGWPQLMAGAKSAMQNPAALEETFSDLELCWEISEESEELSEFARAHLVNCWRCVEQLATSQRPTVRWQAYDVASFAGQAGERMLRNALQDTDSYCLRRALLGLARLSPKDAQSIARPFLSHSDPYVVRAAQELMGSRDNTQK
jgi:hypothetical protein